MYLWQIHLSLLKHFAGVSSGNPGIDNMPIQFRFKISLLFMYKKGRFCREECFLFL